MNRLTRAALALAISSPALAQTITDPAIIDQQVAAFAGAPIGAPGGAVNPVDRRLKLRPCTAGLALDWQGVRRDLVQVSCPLPGGWRIYVPLRSGGNETADAAPLVARGDAVTVIVDGGGFAVSQQGEALESGSLGAWIRVRLGAARSEPLRARVLRPGAVGIDLP
jgi:flagella basal body P-ring formation protein FlgA